MKKTIKYFGFIAVAAMAIVGCAKEIDAPKEELIEEPQEKVVETHTVTISAGSPETKTSIVEGVSSASFKWSSDDATRFHIFENEVEGTDIGLETSDEYVTVKLTATFATVTAASYTYTAFLAKNVYDDDYPQVPSAQTCTGTAYDPNADILIAKPVTNEGDVLDKLNMQFGRPCVINKMTLKGLTAGETLSAVEINADKALTGYYDVEGKEWTDVSNSIVISTSQLVPATGEVVVYFVTKPVDSATLTVTAITDAHVYDKTFSKTINFVMDQVTTFGVSGLTQYVKRDVLTLPLTTISGNSYDDFSSKNYAGAGHSSAVYAGTIAGGNNAIQLNANSGTSYRGIVTTTSGGSIKMIRVKWESHTADSRDLTVYGKNTAYSTSDLNNSFGTELGSVTSGSSTEVSFVNYYEYIMLKASKAIYLDEIQIFWNNTKTDSGIKWTADGNSGDAVTSASGTRKSGDDIMPTVALYNPNSLGVTYSSTDESVATINSSTGVITLLTGGETTIKATFAGNETYRPIVVGFTLTVTDSRSTVATPSFSPGSGSVEANTTIRISSDTPNATVYYKVGSVPTTESYDGYSTLTDASDRPYIDITIDVAKTVHAIAVKDDWLDSNSNSAVYTIKGVSTDLDAPDNVAITAMNASSFTAVWDASENASGYSWKISTSSDSAAAAITNGTGTIDSGSTETVSISSGITLTAGTTYYFHIKATSSSASYNDSDYSTTHVGFLSIIPNKATTGSDSNSYVTTETQFTTGEVTYKINNWNPNTLQIKGGGSGSNFFTFRNTTALPGKIRKIELNVSSDDNTIVASKSYISLGTSSISTNPASTGTTANDGTKQVYWTSSAANTYFYIGMAKGGTSGTCNLSDINILYETGTE